MSVRSTRWALASATLHQRRVIMRRRAFVISANEPDVLGRGPLPNQTRSSRALASGSGCSDEQVVRSLRPLAAVGSVEPIGSGYRRVRGLSRCRAYAPPGEGRRLVARCRPGAALLDLVRRRSGRASEASAGPLGRQGVVGAADRRVGVLPRLRTPPMHLTASAETTWPSRTSTTTRRSRPRGVACLRGGGSSRCALSGIIRHGLIAEGPPAHLGDQEGEVDQ